MACRCEFRASIKRLIQTTVMDESDLQVNDLSYVGRPCVELSSAIPDLILGVRRRSEKQKLSKTASRTNSKLLAVFKRTCASKSHGVLLLSKILHQCSLCSPFPSHPDLILGVCVGRAGANLSTYRNPAPPLLKLSCDRSINIKTGAEGDSRRF